MDIHWIFLFPRQLHSKLECCLNTWVISISCQNSYHLLINFYLQPSPGSPSWLQGYADYGYNLLKNGPIELTTPFEKNVLLWFCFFKRFLTLSAHSVVALSVCLSVSLSVCHFFIMENVPFLGLKLTSVHSR